MTTTFDVSEVRTLLSKMHTFLISLPIVFNLVTNPGSERISWRPLFEVRNRTLGEFHDCLERLEDAYTADRSVHSPENERLLLKASEQYEACIQGVVKILEAHREKLPENEELAWEAEAMRATMEQRMEEVRERANAKMAASRSL